MGGLTQGSEKVENVRTYVGTLRLNRQNSIKIAKNDRINSSIQFNLRGLG